MARITVQDDRVQVELSLFEKIGGLVGDQMFPRASIVEATAVPNGLDAVRGLRAPGLGLPGLKKIGTWRARDGKSFVVVHGQGPALRLRLTDGPWREAVISTPEAREIASRITALRAA